MTAADAPTIIEHPSPNHSPRKAGVRVDTIVIHHTATPSTLLGDRIALRTLCSPLPGKRVSAHYLIGHRGSVYRLVPEDRTAWHAGFSCLPWEEQAHGASVNPHSIGIEVVNPGDGTTPFTEAQYRALCWLVPDIVRRLGGDGVVVRRSADGSWSSGQSFSTASAVIVTGHRDVAPGRKTDPADNFDWGRIREALAGGGA